VPSAVEAALGCDRRAEAERLVAEVSRDVAGCDLPGAVAELEHAQGLLHQEAEPATAAEHFARAQLLWQRIGRPYDSARAAERQALALENADPATASGPLAEAVATYRRLNADADLTRCEQHRHRLGLTPSPTANSRRGYGNQLSPRERQVAELAAQGATNQDIATALFLSPRTVELHIARALKKLGTTRKDVRRALTREAAARPSRS
jgi:DNA-binding CsgD family transcriptional regulator